LTPLTTGAAAGKTRDGRASHHDGNQRAPVTGFLSLTLHAHLPYIVNHGTWPHGLEWLLEAAAETYLPMLRMFGRLERDGIPLRCNLTLSPILLEQLSHPVFKAEFPEYIERKINAAREDESYFQSTAAHGYAETARFWQDFYRQSLDQFHYLGGDIVASFRYFGEIGFLDLLTCGATHGYMPLLGTDESLRAQVRVAVETHRRHLGKAPRGIWIPECGYRPAGEWSYPVARKDGSPIAPPFHRIGVEQALQESGLEFFFVDTHLVENSVAPQSPYGPTGSSMAKPVQAISRALYQPYVVATDAVSPENTHIAPTVFPRDPYTGMQVWSGESGYPGDGDYLDFHKKRWPGGHRYWRVTGPHVDMEDKLPYQPQAAAERIQSHAAHFVSLLHEALAASRDANNPPILCAPFDAELFGHWWFEGVAWLEAVARTLNDHPDGLATITCAGYLDKYQHTQPITMKEGSWGAGGDNQVWLNPQTAWTYSLLYEAELFVRDVCSGSAWETNEHGGRVARQLCRELLLLESSDWQFLITTGAARDYAEHRFNAHIEAFNTLKSAWAGIIADGALTDEQSRNLAELEQRDSIFAHIDPAFWRTGGRQSLPPGPDSIPPAEIGSPS
jgi:1,4-alpha-glucan branching enzyme